MTITIESLKNCPQHIPNLALIGYEELGPTWFWDEKRLRENIAHKNALPLTLVALDNGTPAGMCALTQTKDIRPDLTPWLGPVFVAKQYQNHGIGNQLIEEVKKKARMLDFEKLYLCTHDLALATGYYQRRGWRTIGSDKWKGHPVTVMEIVLPTY